MSDLNPYYPRGATNEHALYQSLIDESVRIKGEEFFYIPRQLVAKDDVLTEDALSKFVGSYKVVAYLDNIDSWGGAGNFMARFGVMTEETASLTISKVEWETMVGVHGVTIIPDRPCEGDLMWFPITGSMLEIRFVENQSPFYQLRHQFVYKLKVELFSYSSERFETGIQDVDNATMEATFDLTERGFEMEDGSGDMVDEAQGIISTEDDQDRKWGSGSIYRDEADKFLDFDESNPFAEIER